MQAVRYAGFPGVSKRIGPFQPEGLVTLASSELTLPVDWSPSDKPICGPAIPGARGCLLCSRGALTPIALEPLELLPVW